MLTRIQARNYRCLKHVDQTLSNFDVLVGSNGVGKSTFLEVLSFLATISSPARDGIRATVERLSPNFEDLLFDSEVGSFELAIEGTIPHDVGKRAWPFGFSARELRYQIAVGYIDGNKSELAVLAEQLFIRPSGATSWFVVDAQREKCSIMERAGLFNVRSSVAFPILSAGQAIALIQQEGRDASVGYQFGMRGGSSGLAIIPENPDQFPVATWFRRYLTESLVKLTLEPEKLRRTVPPNFGHNPGQGVLNLPAVVATLIATDGNRFQDWIRHLQLAVPDLLTISVFERPEDRHSYLIAHYLDGRKVPSWLLSDGILRLIGLTLPAYAMDNGSIFLIEEPKNCIHPLAIELVMQSLSSMYESQVFVTTHSPAILSLAAPENILCFSKSVENGTSIVRRNAHPRLSEWKKSIDLGTLLASGILG